MIWRNSTPLAGQLRQIAEAVRRSAETVRASAPSAA
jgi:LysR family hydrogen peroxide-inducible transcriptional activator